MLIKSWLIRVGFSSVNRDQIMEEYEFFPADSKDALKDN